MIEALKNMLGFGNTPDYKDLLKSGGIIIDVRSPQEFKTGNISGSKNYPLNELDKHLTKLKDKNQPIIACCASGMRSGSAKSILKSKGYTQVFNGGGWRNLQGKIN
ncbi:rhodanese-like domain-containing protein [Fulvivirga sp.]|uniref:rhodanese-like domain-containing protein n=1 Tax=Fulvivirga sp. TaxID=1931237 RepID=UPI0032F01C05